MSKCNIDNIFTEGLIWEKRELWSFLLLMLVALSVVLAACASDEASESNTEKENEGTTEGETGSTTTAEEKVLIFGRGGDSVSLDPAAVTDGESFKVTQNVFETLLNFGKQDTTINEGLATKWEASEDGLTYTFTLREGVKFHDGTDFNAEAVVKNFERWQMVQRINSHTMLPCSVDL